MELTFEKNSFSHLKCTMQNVAYQEEIGETVVPDSYPDIYSIICTYADVVIRGKEIRNGSIIVSGAIRGSVIYKPEDHTFPRCLDIYFPFSIKVDHDTIEERSQIIVKAKVCSSDGRAINSRKVLLRTNIGYHIAIYNKCEDELFEVTDSPETLQLKRETYTFCVPSEIAEKSFSLNEKIDIPNSCPPVSKIYRLSVTIDEIDKKLVSNKGIFKGNLHCKMLYLSDDEKLYTYTQVFPFSQFCEFRNDYDTAQLDIVFALTGVDFEHLEGSNTTEVNIDILAEGTVAEEKAFNFITDAYSTTHDLSPEWKSYSIDGQLDQKNENRSVKHTLKGNFSEIIDADAYLSYPDIRRNGNKIQVVVPILLQVIGIGEQQSLSAIQDKTELTQEFDLDDQAQCISLAKLSGELQKSLLSDGVELQFNIDCSHKFCCKQTTHTLCAGSVNDRENVGKEPSVVLRKVKENTDLWDVAKAYRSKKETICAVNNIHGDILSEDQFLLIPVG